MDLRSGAAFWPIRDGLLLTYPSLDRDEVADVAIIGAGVTGALVAQRLAASGVNVVVVDKRDVATGSTAATTGLLLYETDTSLGDLIGAVGQSDAVRAWQLGRAAIDSIERMCGDFGDDCGFSRRDALYFASSRRDARALAGEHALRVQHGFDVTWLSAADALARYGVTVHGALLTPGNAQIDGYRFTHRLLGNATRHGARVYDRTEVVTVDAHDDGVVVHTDRGAQIVARRVVWATGYEAVEETQRRVGRMNSTWVVISEPVPDADLWRDRVLIWETARPYLYARTTEDGRVLLGGEDEPFSRRHENDRLRSKKARRLIERFGKLFPQIRFEVAYQWAGVFATTHDGLPRIGSVPEHPHAWLTLAYGGNGITFAAIAANLIHDAWHGVPNDDARIFAFERK